MNEDLKRELEPFTQAETENGNLFSLCQPQIRRRKELYAVAPSAEYVMGAMRAYMREKWSELDEKNKHLMHWFSHCLQEHKILAELLSLKRKNMQEATRANLVLIPQIHRLDPRQHEDAELANNQMKDQIEACDRSIAGIIETLKPHKPKIAVEGLILGINKNEQDYLKEEKPWIYEKGYDVYGIESLSLRGLLYQFNIACRHDVQYNPEVRERIRGIFSVLVRQQLAIETSLQRLSEDELGAIIIGVVHIPTMRQYLEEHHPNTKVETIVPRIRQKPYFLTK